MSAFAPAKGRRALALSRLLLLLAIVPIVAGGCTTKIIPTTEDPMQSARKAWSQTRQALVDGNDVAVYAVLADSLRPALHSTPDGAAQSVRTMLPTDLNALAPKQVSDNEVWMVDSSDNDNRVEFERAGDGWRIKTISSNVQSEKTEKYTADADKTETDHLPTGTKITIAKGSQGTQKVTYSTVSVNGVAQDKKTVGDPAIGDEATPESIWVGTGPKYDGRAKISQLKIGSDYNRYGVDNKSTVLDSPSQIAIAYRLSNLPSGSGVRVVLLDPFGTEHVGDAQSAGGGVGWTSIWKGSPAAGSYVAVVEVDRQPVVWRQFWVK